MIRTLTLQPKRQGLYLFTDEVEMLVREAGLAEGLCTLFVRHTSCEAQGCANAAGAGCA